MIPSVVSENIFTSIDDKMPKISFFVAGTDGLLMFCGSQCFKLIEADIVYGMIKYNNRWWISFSNKNKGCVISCKLVDKKLEDIRVEIDGLSNKVHQIRFIRGKLFVTETKRNTVVVFPEILSGDKKYFTVGRIGAGRVSPHFNSIFNSRGIIYILAHNKTNKTGQNSEIYTVNYKNMKYIGVQKTKFGNAHNIYKDKKNLIICDSISGSVYNNNKRVLDSKYFTRGLSVSSDYIIVGGSRLSFDPKERVKGSGKVFIMDNKFNRICDIDIPFSQVTEIKRIDKVDGIVVPEMEK